MTMLVTTWEPDGPGRVDGGAAGHLDHGVEAALVGGAGQVGNGDVVAAEPLPWLRPSRVSNCSSTKRSKIVGELDAVVRGAAAGDGPGGVEVLGDAEVAVAVGALVAVDGAVLVHEVGPGADRAVEVAVVDSRGRGRSR